MGTRSVIGVMHGNKAKTVYCHWDGYLSHNGLILQDHYDSPKANHLVALGNLSELRRNIEAPEGVEHTFDKPLDGVCIFYGRDRGEDGCEFRVCQSDQEMFDYYNDCEYFYIMQDGVWLVSQGPGTEWKVLRDALLEDGTPATKAPSITRLIGIEEEA